MTGTGIRRVRVHGGVDATLARQRLGSQLGGAELRPSGLPPAAVLCVRRVRDPLPGALRLDAAEARPPPEWERAFVTSLERVLRGAARPAREAVPAAAEAVLFADRAELLACLARDALAGTAWLHWWWRDLQLAPAPDADPVVAAWLETPEHVPAALQLLAASGKAAAFVASLSEHDATALLLRVAAVHGLPEVRRAVATPAPAVEPRTATLTSLRAEPPWRRVAPETAEPALAPTGELLLGVALVLRRAPQLARSAAFAAATRAWVAAQTRPAAAATPRRPAVPAHAARGGVAANATPVPTSRRRVVTRGPEPTRARDSRAPRAAHDASPPARRRAELPGAARAPRAETTPRVAAAGTQESKPPRPQELRAQSREVARPPAAAPERAARAAVPAPALPRTHGRAVRGSVGLRTAEPVPPVLELQPPELVVETSLGGVFYLLNLALFLEVYGDFTRPLEPGLPLDPWDLLALLAPRLLDEPARDDALWPLLARLAGRGPRERPGRSFRPPPAWRTPPDWLAPFEHEGTWRWSAARGTLRLVHPAGFAVAAVPRTHEPPRVQLARELRRLRPLAPAPLRAALPREPVQPLTRWASRLAAYANARLRLALGPAGSPGAALRCHARVFVTPTHVDVAFRLAELPLEVRVAGLDRTPGWIPAAGRFVAFHFE